MKNIVTHKEKIVRRTAKALKHVPVRHRLDAFLRKGVWVWYELKKK